MISEEEALAAVLEKVSPLSPRKAALLDSLGHFAAEDVWAQRPLPPFDNSAMDGYAVQSASCRAGAKLRVTGEQPAGADRCLTIQAGEAIRIFTGAPIPAGADAVIMQEDVTREGAAIVAQCDIAPGEFVRPKGADLAEGQRILARGEPIAAQTLALLASQGIGEIEVGGRPKVAIVSTGDELAPAGSAPRAGQIFESNSLMLHALARSAGAEVALAEHCPDDLDQLVSLFRRALKTDALIVSGGVSVGDRDLVKPALRELGVEIDLWRVAIKPGKPFLFGRSEAASIFGLPGNPVSAFVTFLKFVRPALLKMSGADEDLLDLRRVPARIGTTISHKGDRPHYLRGRLQDGFFNPIGRQESHALFGLSRANALLHVDCGETLEAGAMVMVEIWD